MRLFNYSGLKPALFLGIIVCAILCTSNVQAQSENYSDGNELEQVIQSFLDPTFPQENRSSDKMGTEIYHIQAMLAYADSQSPFPVYVNTGDRENDLQAYERSVVLWFEENPYFPQFIDTGHPEQDRERFEKIRREWIHRFPERYRELYELVTSDNELMSIYSFVLQ